MSGEDEINPSSAAPNFGGDKQWPTDGDWVIPMDTEATTEEAPAPFGEAVNGSPRLVLEGSAVLAIGAAATTPDHEAAAYEAQATESMFNIK